MKNKVEEFIWKKFKLVFIIFIPIFVLILLSVKSVNADSGWDTDYGSSSWDSGSDSGYEYSSDRYYSTDHSNYRSSSGSYQYNEVSMKDFLLVVATGVGILLVIALVVLFIDSKRNKNSSNRTRQIPRKDITNEYANQAIPGFNIE